MSWPRLVCVVGSQFPVSASAPRNRSALPSAAKAEFTRKSGLTRPKPNAAAPASPPNITSLRLIMSYPSMILATLKLLPRARSTQPFRSSRANRLTQLATQLAKRRPKATLARFLLLHDSVADTPGCDDCARRLLTTRSAAPNSEAAAPLHCAGQE